nr:hypothetical protein CFP56_32395 [Quercus suber]
MGFMASRVRSLHREQRGEVHGLCTAILAWRQDTVPEPTSFTGLQGCVVGGRPPKMQRNPVSTASLGFLTGSTARSRYCALQSSYSSACVRLCSSQLTSAQPFLQTTRPPNGSAITCPPTPLIPRALRIITSSHDHGAATR